MRGGAGLALAGLGGCAQRSAAPPAAKPAPPAVKFAVRSAFATDDLRERAQLLARLGYDGIELGREFLERPAAEILGALDGTRLEVTAIVGSLKLVDPDPEVRTKARELDRKRFLLAKELGAMGVIEVPMFGDYKYPDASDAAAGRARADQLLIESLAQIAPDAERAGVKILLEPLNKKETRYMNLQGHGAAIIEQVRSPAVRLLSDLYHMQLDEADVAAALRAHGKYTAYVHMADGERRTEPGSLPYDYRPAFRELKRHGFGGWLTVECARHTDNDPEASLGRALAYVKRQWVEA